MTAVPEHPRFLSERSETKGPSLNAVPERAQAPSLNAVPERAQAPSLTAVPERAERDEGWLLVIDPQNIFASADSEWGSPFFAAALANIRRLADAHGDRVLVTRWVPTADRSTSWGEYFAAWPFADRPASDPLYELVPGAEDLSPHPSLDLPTFGKWGAELEAIVGRGAHVVLTGVSTDCCVLSTALAGADAGAHLTVATDACAGSDASNHAAALQVMGLYPPQITLMTTAQLLDQAAVSPGGA